MLPQKRGKVKMDEKKLGINKEYEIPEELWKKIKVLLPPPKVKI